MRIWGNWCGPNWTGGKAIPAKEYDWATDPHPQAIDELDMACKIHDFTYGTDGNREQADRLLEKKAERIANERPLTPEGIAARAVALGMKTKEMIE